MWERKQHNRKAEWITNMGRKLEELEKGPKVKIHLDSFTATLKNEPSWKTPGHVGIHRYEFKNFTSIHDSLLKWIDAYKKHIYQNRKQKERQTWSKKTPKRNLIHKLLTHNMPTDDIDDTNSTD